jgi:hypothetical protein
LLAGESRSVSPAEKIPYSRNDCTEQIDFDSDAVGPEDRTKAPSLTALGGGSASGEESLILQQNRKHYPYTIGRQ